MRLRRKMIFYGSRGILIRFWPFWVNFGPILAKMGQIWPLGVNIQYFYVKSILSTWNCVEKWSCLVLMLSWYVFAILGQYWCNIDQNWPNLTLESQYSVFLCKFHIYYLKLCRKVVLFGSLGPLINVWPFGPNLDLWGPISAKKPREMLILLFLWLHFTQKSKKQALVYLGEFFSYSIWAIFHLRELWTMTSCSNESRQSCKDVWIRTSP